MFIRGCAANIFHFKNFPGDENNIDARLSVRPSVYLRSRDRVIKRIWTRVFPKGRTNSAQRESSGRMFISDTRISSGVNVSCFCSVLIVQY